MLAIEIAADDTAVVLVDRVEETFRFIARAERPSTHRPPIGDALPAICEAIGELERLTGRLLLDGETLIRPQRRDGSGVDAVVASCSDVVPLTVVLLADQRSRAAQHALAALRSCPSTLLAAIDLRSADIEERIAALARPGVDVVVVPDLSPADAARIPSALLSVARHTRQRPMAILCGAQAAHYTGPDGVDVEHVPSLGAQDDAEIEPLRAMLRRRLRELLPVRTPGLRRLQTLGIDAVGSVAEDQGLTLRFLAARHKRSLQYVRVDGASTVALAAAKQAYDEAFDGMLGLRSGAPELLRRCGAEAIARWLPEGAPALPGRPEPVQTAALRNRIMNRALRPRLPSVDSDDLVLDSALAREALLAMLPSIGASRTLPDTLIGGGALAACPSPALVALALLDVLPAAFGMVELALDRGMLAAAGCLARSDVTAAASLADTGETLATAVLLGATPPLANTAARVELTPQGGQTVAVDVRRGEVVRLPLARSKRAELRVRPSGLAAGSNRAELRREVSGSTLGIVVDARGGRPALPAARSKRVAALQRWLAALDPGDISTR